jgi:hypothetical protein
MSDDRQIGQLVAQVAQLQRELADEKAAHGVDKEALVVAQGQLAQKVQIETTLAAANAQLIQVAAQRDSLQKQQADWTTAQALLEKQLETVKGAGDALIVAQGNIQRQEAVIADLNSQLAGAKTFGQNIPVLTAKVANLEQKLADAGTQLASAAALNDKNRGDLQTAAETVAALQEQVATAAKSAEANTAQHTVELASAASQQATVNALLVKAKSDYASVAAKFDALYGPVEDGIVLGPAPYLTTADNASHATLAHARRHLLALSAGVSDAQAEAIIVNGAKIGRMLAPVAPPAPPSAPPVPATPTHP